MGGDGSIGGVTIACDGSIGSGDSSMGSVASIGSDGIITVWVVMVAQIVLLSCIILLFS